MNGWRERAAQGIFALAALVSALLTGSIFGFLLFFGLPLLTGGRLTAILTQPWAPYQGAYGIAPMLAGTMAISLLAMSIALPLAMGCAMLISLSGPGPTGRLLRKAVAMMTAVPTVVYGFVGIFLLVPVVRQLFDHGSGMCVLAAGLMLALMVAPTMILFFCDAFARVPRDYGLAVLALGGTETEKLLYVTLPCAWRGVLTGTILALGRAIGDTLIALMIAGNAVRTPTSLLDSARTLTAHIALVFAADTESLEFKSIFACGLLLYLFTAVMVVGIRAAGRRRPGR